MMQSAKILLIDDDPDLIEAARLVLESRGYEVFIASEGEEGLRRMRADRPDLVILDVMMSHMLEGVAVVREMMAEPELTTIPVIMISAIASTEYEEFLPIDDPCLNITAFLLKPVQPDDLLKTVSIALSSPPGGKCEQA